MTISLTLIRFPDSHDIRLATRDAHKLRGYFGNLARHGTNIYWCSTGECQILLNSFTP